MSSNSSEDSFKSIQSVGRLGLINEINNFDGYTDASVIRGIGDDAAVIEKTEQQVVLLTSETFTEGVDFDLTYHPLQHLGYKVVSTTISDVYAMNGTPTAILVNIAMPNKISVDMVKTIYQGMYSAGKDFEVQIVGGDLTASHQTLGISVTAYGEAEKERLTYRSGARMDDAICITGDLGGAMAGLRILMREKKHWEENPEQGFQPDLSDYEYVVKRQLVPAARRDFVESILEHDIRPHAMIDITQGLISEIYQLMEASKVGAYLYQAALPIIPDTRTVADEMKEDVDKYAMYGGEDLELVFTLPEEKVEELAEHFKDFVVIGRITDQEDGLCMQTSEGEVMVFEQDEQGNPSPE